MASDPDLETEITTLIEPWRESMEKPPFTQEQLIVMALVSCGKPMTSPQIIKWIFRTFEYYSEVVCGCFYNENMPRSHMYVPPIMSTQCASPPNKEAAADLMLRNESALYSYSLPVTRIESTWPKEPSYSTTIPSARTFLRDLLEPTRAGSFRFLNLPAELRTRIYEIVLQYPVSGLEFVSRHYRRNNRDSFLATTRIHAAFANATHRFVIPGSERCTIRDLPEILGILLVNKQIYDEAVPCFYSINTFVCKEPNLLDPMLQKFQPSRQQFVRHIAISIEFNTPRSTLSDGLAALAHLPGLRQLNVSVFEPFLKKFWMQKLSTLRKCANADPLDDIGAYNVPGLHILRQMRATLKIVFEGNCANIAACFEVECREGAAVEKQKSGEAAIVEIVGE